MFIVRAISAFASLSLSTGSLRYNSAQLNCKPYFVLDFS